MIICPSCRAKNPTGARTCVSCHADLPGRAAPMGLGDRHVLREDAPQALANQEPPLLEPIDDEDGEDAVVGELIDDEDAVVGELIDDEAELWPIGVDDAPGLNVPLGAPITAPLDVPPTAARPPSEGILIREAPLIIDQGRSEPEQDLPVLHSKKAPSRAPRIELPPVQPHHRPTPTPPPSSQPPRSSVATKDNEPLARPDSESRRRLTPAVEWAVLERDSRGVQWLHAEDDEDSAPVVSGLGEEGGRAAGRYALGDSGASRPVVAEISVATGTSSSDAWDVIDADRLPPFPDLPRIVEAPEAPTSGVVAAVLYALRTRGLVSHQQEVLRGLGSALAKLKRQEAACVEALGRRARENDLVPPGLEDVADAANAVEHGARQRREQADEKKAEREAAERAFLATKAKGEARLAKVEARHAPMAARLLEMRRRREVATARYDELAAREEELRRRAEAALSDEDLGGEIQVVDEKIVINQRSVEEEKALREAAHRECRESLRKVADDLKAVEAWIQKAQRPVESLERQMRSIQDEIAAAARKLAEVESQARAAELSGRRQTDLAHLSVAELDQKLGQALLRDDRPHRRLEKLVDAVERAHRRVAKVESLVNDQLDQLEAVDRDTAKRGWQILIGGSVVAVILLVALLRLSQMFLGSGQ